MAITPPSLDEVDQTLVQAAKAEALAAVAADDPGLDLRPGALGDLLIGLHAVLNARQLDLLERYQSVRSLRDVLADPAAADVDAVDAILSNFNATRRGGARAAGEVTVVVADDVTITVASGAGFSAGGRRFTAPDVVTAKADAGNVDSDHDRLFRRTADGHFAFTVPVVADDDGAESEVRQGTAFTPDALPPGFVTAYAAGDFTGGLSAETSAELLRRLAEGLPARTVGNRLGMRSWLRNDPEFGSAVRSSVIGAGDPEMLRDKHNVLGVALGGRIDWYVRTAVRAAAVPLTKSAVHLDPDATGVSVWQFSVGRDDAPGFYEVRSIRLAGELAAGGGLEIVADVRGLDTSGIVLPPDLANVAEGTFSRYQSAVVRFRDPDTDPSTAAGTTRDYDFSAVALPQLGALQDTLADRDHAAAAADVLVLAPVPCFVSIGFAIDRPSGSAVPDLDAVKMAVAAAVNATGFTGRLFASQVLDAVRSVLGQHPGRVGTLDLAGRLLAPDGETLRLRDPEVLQVPDLPGRRVTARTTQFFADSEDVVVTDRPGLLSDES